MERIASPVQGATCLNPCEHWWAGGGSNSRPSDYENRKGLPGQFRQVPRRVRSQRFLGSVAGAVPAGTGVSRQISVSLDTSWTPALVGQTVFSGVLEISSEPRKDLDPLDVARFAPKTALNEVGSMRNRICSCHVGGIAEQLRRFRAPVERPSRRPPPPIRYSTVRTYTSVPRLRKVSR